MTATLRARGFTLIELVCVIVILGILAATAVPKFADLAKEARIAKLNAMAGALHSTAQLWNAACLLAPPAQAKCIGSVGVTVDDAVTKNGLSANVYNGYPNAGNSIGYNQIDVLVNTVGFVVSIPSLYYTKFSIADAPTPATCAVTYCENSAAPPAADAAYCTANMYKVTVFTAGCG